MSAVLTIGELAEYLKISKSSLYKLVHDGRIPGKKVGRHWRFSREIIDSWLAAGDENNTQSESSTFNPRIEGAGDAAEEG